MEDQGEFRDIIDMIYSLNYDELNYFMENIYNPHTFLSINYNNIYVESEHLNSHHINIDLVNLDENFYIKLLALLGEDKITSESTFEYTIRENVVIVPHSNDLEYRPELIRQNGTRHITLNMKVDDDVKYLLNLLLIESYNKAKNVERLAHKLLRWEHNRFLIMIESKIIDSDYLNISSGEKRKQLIKKLPFDMIYEVSKFL